MDRVLLLKNKFKLNQILSCFLSSLCMRFCDKSTMKLNSSLLLLVSAFPMKLEFVNLSLCVGVLVCLYLCLKCYPCILNRLHKFHQLSTTDCVLEIVA